MRPAPLHLTDRDFDAFAAEKPTLNGALRPRLELRRRALAWARAVVQRLAEEGLDLDVQGSDDAAKGRGSRRADCQWVWFSRRDGQQAQIDRLIDGVATGRGAPVEAKRALDADAARVRHAYLALRVDARGVEVCVALHPEAEVDVENLRARLGPAAAGEASSAALELIGALEVLPEQFSIRVGHETLPCNGATLEGVRAIVDRSTAEGAPVWIGWRVARDTAVEHSHVLDEQLEDALVALGHVYRLVAWSKREDLIGLEARLAGRERARARDVAAAGAIERGGRVRVRSGPFAEKVGSVSELDGRGGARVLFGLLASHFDLAELEPVVEGRERPAFQSSHRRPLQHAPRKAR